MLLLVLDIAGTSFIIMWTLLCLFFSNKVKEQKVVCFNPLHLFGYWSKPEQTTNCQLSVTVSSLTNLVPHLTSSLCAPLPDSLVLWQTHRYFASQILKQKPLASTLSLYQSKGIISLLMPVTFSLPMLLKLC